MSIRKVGLTGSIGMGKSTTARMFAKEGIPVYDADLVVHRLYGEGGAAVKPVGELFPGALKNGAIDREALRTFVVGDDEAMAELEKVVHPMVRAEENAFLKEAEAGGAPFVVFDIPLLYETGGEERMDTVIVVSAPEDVQRRRVLERGTMDAEAFEAILKRQVPDTEKRARADLVIDTGGGLEPARRRVRQIIELFSGDDIGRSIDIDLPD